MVLSSLSSFRDSNSYCLQYVFIHRNTKISGGSRILKRGFSSNSALAHRGAWLRSSGKKNSPSFFTFQNGLSSHIHALHYLVHDIVLNFDDGGNLRTTVKSIRKVMKSETRLILLASYTTYPV